MKPIPANNNRPNVTSLIEKWRNDTYVRNREIAGQLFPLIYDDLVKIAQRIPFSERVDAREIVHELFMKWQEGGRLPNSWKNRAHFFATARVAMRHLLIDNHRQRKSEFNVAFDDGSFSTVDFLLVDEILSDIGKAAPRFEAILYYKLVVGLTDEETAEALEVSEATAKRQFKAAKSKLREYLQARLVR